MSRTVLDALLRRKSWLKTGSRRRRRGRNKLVDFTRCEIEAEVDCLKACFDRLLERCHLFPALSAAVAWGTALALEEQQARFTLRLAVVGALRFAIWQLRASPDRALAVGRRT